MDLDRFSMWISENYEVPFKSTKQKVLDIQYDIKKMCEILYGYETTDASNSLLTKVDYLGIWAMMSRLKKNKVENYFEISILFWYCVEILDNYYTVQSINEEMGFPSEVCDWLLNNTIQLAEIRAKIVNKYITPYCPE